MNHSIDPFPMINIGVLPIDTKVIELNFILDFLMFGLINFHVLLFLFLYFLSLIVTLHYNQHKHVLYTSVKHETVNNYYNISSPSIIIIIYPHFSI